MPTCYLLAVSRGSSLDKYSNNWSIFNLVEKIKTTAPKPDEFRLVNLEVHAYWFFESEELGVEFDWRLVAVTEHRTLPAEKILTLKSEKPRLRTRAKGFPILEAGLVKLRVEWRRKGDEAWTDGGRFWPVKVEFAEPEEIKQKDLAAVS